MKVIDRVDLVILLCNLSDRKNFSSKELERLLDVYGDDYFIEGNQFVKTKESPKMKEIRDRYLSSVEIRYTHRSDVEEVLG